MAVLQLGDLRWRIDPNSINWSFQLDTAVINTLGGQVVQVLGATLSDLVIQGAFGMDHTNGEQGLSWRLAAAFHQKIKSFMDRQTLPAKTVHSKSKKSGILSDAGVVHEPLTLNYHDGVHNWTFKVLVKALDDGDGSGSLNITNGKFNYTYKLTLFIVQADTDVVRKIATDYFLSRLADGLGWKQSKFNGPLHSQDAQDFIQVNGGTVSAFLSKVLTGEPLVDPTVTPRHENAPVPVGRRPAHGPGAI
jgi:hypothetical protein